MSLLKTIVFVHSVNMANYMGDIRCESGSNYIACFDKILSSESLYRRNMGIIYQYQRPCGDVIVIKNENLFKKKNISTKIIIVHS